MAVGVGGWGQSKAPRAGRAARVEAHAEVVRAEAELSRAQKALRTALAGATADLDAAVVAMADAESALLMARTEWAASAGLTTTPAAPATRPAPVFERSLSWSKPKGAPRPSFTHGAWI